MGRVLPGKQLLNEGCRHCALRTSCKMEERNFSKGKSTRNVSKTLSSRHNPAKRERLKDNRSSPRLKDGQILSERGLLPESKSPRFRALTPRGSRSALPDGEKKRGRGRR
eukprot:768465-Hanusia_phi.AAC.7